MEITLNYSLQYHEDAGACNAEFPQHGDAHDAAPNAGICMLQLSAGFYDSIHGHLCNHLYLYLILYNSIFYGICCRFSISWSLDDFTRFGKQIIDLVDKNIDNLNDHNLHVHHHSNDRDDR